MPFVNIRLVREVIAADPAAKKAAIAKDIARSISAATGLPETEVWVVFEEVAARDWYLGPKDVESLRFGKG